MMPPHRNRMTPTQVALYQAEVARRNKEGVPAGEQPSFLSRASCEPGATPNVTVYVDDAIYYWGKLRSEPEPPAISEFLLSLFGPKDRVRFDARRPRRTFSQRP